MNIKQISVLIRKSPYDDLRVSEAMRMSVGLTLRNIEVCLLFLEDGLDALIEGAGESSIETDFRKHLETFVELGQTLVAERESMEERESASMPLDPEIWNRDAIFAHITQCDGIVVV